MKFPAILTAMVLAAAMPAPAFAASYDAFASFRSGTGPFGTGDGQFLYAVGNGGGFLLTSTTGCPANTVCRQTAAASATDPYVLKSTAGPFTSGTVSIPGDALVLRPGQNNSVQIAWIAPVSGLYKITAEFFRLDSTPDFAAISPFYATVRGGPQIVEAFTLLSPNSPVFSYTRTIAIGSGGYFAFDVHNANTGFASDSTGVRFLVSSAVPEPATWAMMIFGLGAIGSRLRRRDRALVRAAA